MASCNSTKSEGQKIPSTNEVLHEHFKKMYSSILDSFGCLKNEPRSDVNEILTKIRSLCLNGIRKTKPTQYVAEKNKVPDILLREYNPPFYVNVTDNLTGDLFVYVDCNSCKNSHDFFFKRETLYFDAEN